MLTSLWLSMLCSALGLLSFHTAASGATVQDDKKPTVIILRMLTEETENQKNEDGGKNPTDKKPAKQEGDLDEDDEKDMKEGDKEKDEDEGDDDDDDDKVKSKKAKKGSGDKDNDEKAAKSKAKKAKAAKKAKGPKQPKAQARKRPEQPRDEPGRKEELRRARPKQNRPEGGFQFRWEGDGPRGPEREEGRGGPPDEMRRRFEQERAELERRRDEIERHANEMRAEAERMRREMEERSRRSDVAPQELQQLERKNRELVERLEVTQRQLEERTVQMEKLRGALAAREKAIIELKQALAKQGAKQGIKQADKPVFKPKATQPLLKFTKEEPIDPALVARVERLEAEINRLMAILKQQQPSPDQKPTLKFQVKPAPKVGEQKPAQPAPEANAQVQGVITLNLVPSVHPADAPPAIKIVPQESAPVIEKAKDAVAVPQVKEVQSVVVPKSAPIVPDGGLLRIGSTEPMARLSSGEVIPYKKWLEQQAAKNVTPEAKPAINDIPPPAPLPDPELSAQASKPATPTQVDAASVGGVGIVEGNVVALLPNEGKFVLRVSTWHDGKQVRADWVGQQISINQGALPAVKPGDHISLDARIESGKGLVWGGKVFQSH